jgi:hypothetical protein
MKILHSLSCHRPDIHGKIKVVFEKTAVEKLTVIICKSGVACSLMPSMIEESSSFLTSNFFNACAAILSTKRAEYYK